MALGAIATTTPRNKQDRLIASQFGDLGTFPEMAKLLQTQNDIQQGSQQAGHKLPRRSHHSENSHN